MKGFAINSKKIVQMSFPVSNSLCQYSVADSKHQLLINPMKNPTAELTGGACLQRD